MRALACLLLLVPGLAVGDEGTASAAASPCGVPQMSQFDFWVGTWQVSWEGGHGTNRVEKTLDGCVLVEHFDGRPGLALRGTSVSTFDRRTRRWRQTWVDNQAGYLDFDGGWDGERMVLSRRAEGPDGGFLQRMVWYDIADSTLEWSWQRSDDDGKSWRTLWAIHYERMPEGQESGPATP